MRHTTFLLALLGTLLLAAAPLSRTAVTSTPLAPPLLSAVLTQPFGCTSLILEPVDPACPGGHFHSGVDLAAPAGTRVFAAAAGTAGVSHDVAGYGLYVVLTDGPLATLYAHLESATVRSGQWVDQGEMVGRVGSSGLATGPHLHFEVREAGVAVDPLPLLPQGFIVREV